jgi:phosphatidylglycerol:prolipoprotein diacylglycerol transferase
MLQEIFRIRFGSIDLPIYGYGLMLVIGFMAAAHLAKFLARRSGLDGEIFMNAALLALVTGILGARLSHVLENWAEFTKSDRSLGENLWNMINLRSGGLTYYGGFLLAFPTLLIYGRLKKVPLALGMDIMAPAIMLGLAFGRIGCFLNGCCYGAQCDLPWAVRFPYYSNAYMEQFDAGRGPLKPPADLLRDIGGHPVLLSPGETATNPTLLALRRGQRSLPVHPAQLYSAITCFLLVGLLYAYFTLPHLAGRVFALMLILEGATRFILELLRVEPAVLGHFSLSMIIGLGMVALGGLLWLVFGRVGMAVQPTILPDSSCVRAAGAL